MKWLRLGLVVVALLVLGLPELRRYAAERSLYRAVGLAQLLSAGTVPSRGFAAARADSLAQEAARGLPGDPRPFLARGEAQLGASHAPEAREAFLQTLALSERADALLGVGLAESLAGRKDAARAAFLRAAWVSPSVLPRIPEPDRTFVRSEVVRLERLFVAGRLSEIPAPPNAR